ncbi:bifunctional diaminohydroxyphosphoribosylaminopyrimidine deaminase/5-amino-6-(5-phosphoribosylamino)uracil reductase RibD [soil metagenome]
MRHALDLALRGTGHVSPNPRVGCVIVHNNVVIAEGWHAQFGGMHAEVHALSSLSSVPSDAILYVTLEPCSHHGKTPPCVNAILSSEIKHVVVGTIDPNPQIAGVGIDTLRDHGVEVVVGVLHDECQWINRAFIKHITTQRPYIILKVAQSLDGKIAASDGTSKWITSELSRQRVHELRAEVDAVLTGIGTVRADNPSFTVRLANGRHPARLVLDSRCTLDPTSALATSALDIPTIVCCDEAYGTSHNAARLRDVGVIVLGLPCNDGKIDLHVLFATLGSEHNISSILVESGPGLVTSLLDGSYVDELRFHIAPIIMGTGVSWNDIPSMKPSAAQRWSIVAQELVGTDVHLTCLPVNA